MDSFARPMSRPSLPVRRLAAAGTLLAALAGQMGQAHSQAQRLPPEQGGMVVLKRSDCTRLQVHQPAPDVNYQPGVDVRGRPVVPADLASPAPIAMPEEITIAISVELQSRFGIPATSSLYKPEAGIGTVVVKPDGSATFNGQPLTSQEQSALAYLCQRQGPLGR